MHHYTVIEYCNFYLKIIRDYQKNINRFLSSEKKNSVQVIRHLFIERQSFYMVELFYGIHTRNNFYQIMEY